MSMMSNVFKGVGSTLGQIAKSEPGKTFLIGGTTSMAVLGLGLWSSLSEDTLKNESVYARRYIAKYRKYNIEQAAAAGGTTTNLQILLHLYFAPREHLFFVIRCAPWPSAAHKVGQWPGRKSSVEDAALIGGGKRASGAPAPWRGGVGRMTKVRSRRRGPPERCGQPRPAAIGSWKLLWLAARSVQLSECETDGYSAVMSTPLRGGGRKDNLAWTNAVMRDAGASSANAQSDSSNGALAREKPSTRELRHPPAPTPSRLKLRRRRDVLAVLVRRGMGVLARVDLPVKYAEIVLLVRVAAQRASQLEVVAARVGEVARVDEVVIHDLANRDAVRLDLLAKRVQLLQALAAVGHVVVHPDRPRLEEARRVAAGLWLLELHKGDFVAVASLQKAVLGAADAMHGVDGAELHTHGAFVEADGLLHVLADERDVVEAAGHARGALVAERGAVLARVHAVLRAGPRVFIALPQDGLGRHDLAAAWATAVAPAAAAAAAAAPAAATAAAAAGGAAAAPAPAPAAAGGAASTVAAPAAVAAAAAGAPAAREDVLDERGNCEAGGAIGLHVVDRACDVEVGPLDAVAHKGLEKQAGRERPARTRAGVAQVRDRAVQSALVASVQRWRQNGSPARAAAASRSAAISGLRAKSPATSSPSAMMQAPVSVATSITSLQPRSCAKIMASAQREAALRVRIVHLDRGTVARAQDVAGPHGVAAGHVLAGGHDEMHLDVVRLDRRDGLGGAQHGGGAAHVELHELDQRAVADLDVDAAAVKGDPLAHQRDALADRAGRRVGGVDEPRRLARPARHAQVQPHPVVSVRGAGLRVEHVHAEAAAAVVQAAAEAGQEGWRGDVGRRVDQLEGRAHAGGDLGAVCHRRALRRVVAAP
eukprot:CAMPEP_0202070582 /NCGR_PEP_ID=MMETSP0964-20121228/1255_1 /ASSEMBLY_ACC=CAM_ASM_000500 /TAXON_ID=4773 /ORGANISM="Schizochytrium aggregatum, Strain ATCC28209" /LENGTH=877 /DNA_ID=CAMNT_0048637465 /DNA_START=89 /DNA_END=2719 /DNA_ORIENTATION=+